MKTMKYFNTEGACIPQLHYMVNLDERCLAIRKMVEKGYYFTINRSRQYGKTTTLAALSEFLRKDYSVVFLDFQDIGDAGFATEELFVKAFLRLLLWDPDIRTIIPGEIALMMQETEQRVQDQAQLDTLFHLMQLWCERTDCPVLLLIDEIDNATNNQVFLDFLAGLRSRYMKRSRIATFQSVILAGVHDIRNIRRKLRPDEDIRYNSPWNIAADFDLDMSLSQEGIADMLQEYENDHHTGMDIGTIAKNLREYTSGYPYLVSRLCKLIDEKLQRDWTMAGFLAAVRTLMQEKNTLFDSLTGRLYADHKLKELIRQSLMNGKEIPYSAYNPQIDTAVLYGFMKEKESKVVISNRVFEGVLYNLFLSEQIADSRLYDAASLDTNQFVHQGHLDVELILQKFVETFDYYYGDNNEEFIEKVGRNYFLLFLKPIINGTGNIYIEAETRNRRRTDIIIDYRGEQFIIECKIWHGNEYHTRGEQQLQEYLEYYRIKKGYMLSFNFNRNKQIGLRHVMVGDKMLAEAVV